MLKVSYLYVELSQSGSYILSLRLFLKIEMTSFPYMEVMSHRPEAQSCIAAFNHYTFCFFQIEWLAIYVNFTQFILKNKLFRVVFRLY